MHKTHDVPLPWQVRFSDFRETVLRPIDERINIDRMIIVRDILANEAAKLGRTIGPTPGDQVLDIRSYDKGHPARDYVLERGKVRGALDDLCEIKRRRVIDHLLIEKRRKRLENVLPERFVAEPAVSRPVIPEPPLLNPCVNEFESRAFGLPKEERLPLRPRLYDSNFDRDVFSSFVSEERVVKNVCVTHIDRLIDIDSSKKYRY